MRKWLSVLLALLLTVLAGCDDTDQLKQQIQSLQTQLNTCRMGVQKDLAQAQSEVDQAWAWRWSGPVQWLPVWDMKAVRAGLALSESPLKEVDSQGKTWVVTQLQPDADAWLLLAAIWMGVAALAAGLIAPAWLVIRRATWSAEIDRLKNEAARLREQNKPLENIQANISSATAELRTIKSEIDRAQREAADINGAIETLEARRNNLEQEIEQAIEDAKDQALREHRAELQAKHAQSQDVMNDLENALKNL